MTPQEIVMLKQIKQRATDCINTRPRDYAYWEENMAQIEYMASLLVADDLPTGDNGTQS